jgi:hypothetical protein
MECLTAATGEPMLRSALAAVLCLVLGVSLLVRYNNYRTDSVTSTEQFAITVGDVLQLNNIPAERTAGGYETNFPGCKESVQIVLFTLMLPQPDLLASHADTTDHKIRYFYIEQSSPTMDAFPMYIEWFKHTALSLVGRSPYVASRGGIMVEEPPGCTAAENFDWPRIWRQQRLQMSQSTKNVVWTRRLVGGLILAR